jgi:chemotaxis protein histidine kinase CheA
MIESKRINFSQFYIREFFSRVQSVLPQKLAAEEAKLVNELIQHLDEQEQVTNAIARVAEEQGSGELSIFLFDIIDRVEDYLPTTAYQGLPETVNDFVNGLALMVEEESLRKAIKNVNGKFAAESEKVIGKIRKIPPPPRKAKIEKQLPVTKKPEPLRDEINIERFMEIEFNTQLRDNLLNRFDTDQAAQLNKFIEIAIRDLKQPIPKNSPTTLTDILSQLGSALPWIKNKSYQATKLYQSLSGLIGKITKNLEILNNQHEPVIRDSIASGKIIIPEVVKKVKFEKEEIPEQPTTIDNLLSEYFQSEVDEHVQKCQKIITEISANPAETKNLNILATQLQSFKEISMIHGYTVIEDFCAEIITILNEGVRKKKFFNLESFQIFETFFGLLKNADQLKDIRQKNPQLEQLQQLPELMRNSLFARKKRGEKSAVEPQPEPPAKVEEISKEAIPYTNRSAILSLFSDVLQTVRVAIQEVLMQKLNPPAVNPILNTLIAAAQLIKAKEINQFLQEFNKNTNQLQTTDPQYKAAVVDLLEIYNQVAHDLPVKIDWPQIAEKLQNFETKFFPARQAVAFSDRNSLLKILLGVEKTNLATFTDRLAKIFIEKNEWERKEQIGHFTRLADNLKLLQAPKTQAFTDYYIALFRLEKPFTPDPIIFNEMRQVYKLFLQSLETKGMQTDAGELITVLKEIIHPEKVEHEPESAVPPAGEMVAEEITVKPVPAAPEKIEAGEEEGEEDLEEIFKLEASKDLEKAEEALAQLESGGFNREPFKIIERSLHSVKSSARLMGYNDVANLAAPLEDIGEKMQSPTVMADENLVPVIREILQGLRQAISKEAVDFSLLKMKLKAIKLVEKDIPAAAGETAASDERKVKAEEKPLFAAAGTEDEDLLQIFKEESAEYLRILETAVKTLTRELNNPEALNQLEHASHSLKSAAKMLGFREIGQIGDSLESVAESIQKGEIANETTIMENVAAALKVIRNLAAGEKYDPDTMSEVLHNLDLQNLKVKQSGKPQTSSARQFKADRIQLSSETELFLKEAWELIEKINQDLLKLEKKPDDRAVVDNLCRNLHTLKGSAQIMQFENIGKLAHRIEDILEKVKTSTPNILGESMDVIFKGVDEIQAMVEAIKAGRDDISPGYESALADLNLILGHPAAVPVTEVDKIQEIKPRLKETEAAPASSADQEQVIKITTERLDKLVNMAAELVVNKAQFLNYLDSLRKIGNILEQGKVKLKSTSGTLENILEKPERVDQKTRQFAELTKAYKEFKEMLEQLESASSDFNLLTRYVEQNISQISSLTKLLHDDILQVRMVPTEILFNRFPRAVRDLAKKQSKKVNLVIEGSDTEMDRAVVESLTDPIMHLIRNAIDHGVEPPAERVKKGKSEDGIILLKAYREKNQVIIEVQDDGQGMDVAKIKAMIKKKKLASEQEIERMSETDLLFFVFYPGFSTKEVASDISGRGVGLDVVAAQLHKIKGDIRISSKPDKGTSFSIRIPLTMAITPAVLVEQNQNVLAIPLTTVEETVQFKADQVQQTAGKSYLTLHQESIPMVGLFKFLNYGPSATKKSERNICLVIRETGIKYALVVDQVLRREDIVVKSLGEPLSRLNYVAGGTILGDGSVALVLDVPAITRKILLEYYGREQDFSSIELARKKIQQKQQTVEAVKPTREEIREPEFVPIARKKITGRKALALIIDDSISVRKFVSSVLERYNYITVLASNGPEALTALKKSEFDIVITDLEMPEMHGFELIEKIRKNEKYKQLPIVILTGRAGEESKEMGKRLGANAYIIKPFKETDLLKTLEKFIET